MYQTSDSLKSARGPTHQHKAARPMLPRSNPHATRVSFIRRLGHGPCSCCPSSTIVLPFQTATNGRNAMVRKITLRQVGGSIGATLPKDMAERLNVDVGDEV